MLISAPYGHDRSGSRRQRQRPVAFQPYVPATQSPAEFTLKAIVIGALFGLLFGASTVYLGLRAGLTVSASIPIAVLAISVLKRLGGSTILENNIVQTIGSAGESVAGGVVFTIPALIFLTPRRAGVLQLLPDHDARVRRRHPRRADDGAAAPRADRQGARRPALSGRRGLRRRADRRRTRRHAGGRRSSAASASARSGRRCRGSSRSFRTDVGYSMARTSLLPERDAERRHLARVHGRRLRHRPAHRRRRCSPAACCRGWCCCRCCRSSARYITVPFPPVTDSRKPATAHSIRDERAAVVERLHPLHRRRRGARRRPHHARAARFRRSSRRSATA